MTKMKDIMDYPRIMNELYYKDDGVRVFFTANYQYKRVGIALRKFHDAVMESNLVDNEALQFFCKENASDILSAFCDGYTYNVLDDCINVAGVFFKK